MSRSKSSPLKLVMAVFCVLLAAAIEFRAEIPSGFDLPTTKQFLERQLAFDLKTSINAYNTTGLKNPAWDDAAIRFIGDAERRMIDQVETAELIELERQGRELYLNGCDDPMVELEYARVLFKLERFAQAERFFRGAADSLGKQGYAANRQAFAATYVYALLKKRGAAEEARTYGTMAAKRIGDIFTTAAYGPDDRPLLIAALEALLNPMSGAQKEQVLNEVKNIPNIDPVAIRFIEGEYQITAAWDERGSGLANTVTPQGWEGFHKHLDEARRCLTEAWDLDHAIPETATAMMTVALGSAGAEEMRAWFDRATAARFDHAEAYRRYIHGLYPQWHGTRQKLLDFGEECLATGRFDTHVPVLLIDSIATVRAEYDHGDMSAWSGPETYDKVKSLLDKALAPGARHANSDYYRSLLAAFAVRGERWHDARAALDQIATALDPAATVIVQLTPEEVRGAIFAYTAGGLESALKGKELAAAGKRTEAIAAYQIAIKEQKDATALRYLKRIVQVLRWEMDFEAGNVVALAADKDFSGFRRTIGKWTADSDGGLVGKALAEEQLLIQCDADFGDHWELTAQIDFLHVNADWTSSGVTVCAPNDVWYQGLLVSPRDHKFNARVATRDASETNDAPVKQHNEVTLRCQGAELTMLLNGVEIYKGDTPGDHPKIGFGGWPIYIGDGVRFTKLRIRRIE